MPKNTGQLERDTTPSKGTESSGNELRVTVHYPSRRGRILLRTSQDWEKDVEPIESSGDGTRSEFAVRSRHPYLYFKPILRPDGAAATGGSGTFRWANGENYLVVANLDDPTQVYPHFQHDATCSVCTRIEAPSEIFGQPVGIRVFHPPGYEENRLQRFPVLFMQDGRNLFFTEDSPAATWRMAETLALLNGMNAIQRIIVVGVDPPVRQRDYTAPGYEAFGHFMAEELAPQINAAYRTLEGPENTAVMGSSLGAVASFYLGWQWPEVFGQVGCLSPTFGWRDDLLGRVESETKKPLRIYLDSGWPRDNFEMARSMRATLLSRGYQRGSELLYLAFPLALHDEKHWATRCHLPFQFFFGTPPPRAPSP